jgi:hypothetical protein
MRRFAVLALLAVLVGALIARRRRSRTAAPLEAPRQPPIAVGSVPATPPRPEPAAAPLAPPSGFVSVAWTLVSAPQERPELALRCPQDDELVLDRVDVQETPTQVFVTALARRQPRGDDEPARREADATVALSRPLGGRELIPAPVDDEPDSPALYA